MSQIKEFNELTSFSLDNTDDDFEDGIGTTSDTIFLAFFVLEVYAFDKKTWLILHSKYKKDNYVAHPLLK